MILSAVHEGQHVDDGDLIRLRDGECSCTEERRFRDHIESCATCRENAERLEWLATGFVEAMDEIPHAVPLPKFTRKVDRCAAGTSTSSRPIRWHPRQFLRVAAVLAMAFALSLTAAPVRALVATGWEAIRGFFQSTSTLEQEMQQTSSMVSFVPQGEEFLIDVVNIQSIGTLSVAVDTSASASARVIGGDGLDELVVLQSGLRVRNRTISTASYVLTLPPSLSDLEVRIAGRTIGVFSTRQMTGSSRLEMDLSNP